MDSIQTTAEKTPTGRHTGLPIYTFVRLLLTAVITVLATLTGCENYQYTLNEQPVFEKAGLFTNYSIPDAALADCINQAIIDKKITESHQLTQLNCNSAGIKSTQGIEVFTTLHTLNLSHNALTDIRHLLLLTNLSRLSLEHNPSLNCRDMTILKRQVKVDLRLPQQCSNSQ